MAIEIPPAYDGFGIRRIATDNGTMQPGRLVLQFDASFSVSEQPETTTTPRCTKISLSGRFSAPFLSALGQPILFLTSASNKVLELAEDGAGNALLGFFGHSPALRPSVSVVGGVAALRSALVDLGLISEAP